MKISPAKKRILFVCFIICLNVLVSFLILKNRNSGDSIFDNGMAYAQDHEGKGAGAEGGHGSEDKDKKKVEEKHGEETKKGGESGGHGSSEGGGHGEAEGGHGEGKKAGSKEGAASSGEDDKSKKPSVESKFTLNSLEDKRNRLMKQEEQLKAEQEKMKKMKLELDEKINQLEKTHALIDESLAKFDKKKSEKEQQKKDADEKRMKQLVKMYSTMKPKQAGEIFNKMDIVIAEKIMLSMKGDVAGRILAYIESSKAALISERLAMTMGRNVTNP